MQVANTLTNLGIAYGQLGDPRKQKDLLERALKIQENTSGRRITGQRLWGPRSREGR